MAAAMTPMPMEEEPMAAPDNEGSSGVCIEIRCKPDGTFEVSSEPLPEEMSEEGPEGAAREPAGQPASNFGEALKMAVALYKQSTASTATDQMGAGYAS